ncbi:MAG: glutamate--tRNA ligase [Planctomycetota bacterium]
MTSDQTPAITRFAPSPTGHLHIGGARTALFCWAYARRTGGRFILRIEDTDRARSSEDAARGILEDLAWLGIGWDDGPEFGGFGGDERGVGPFHQSRRLELYNARFEELIEQGIAYPAFETPDELNAMRAEAEAAKRTFVYRQRAEYDHAAAVERAKTEEHVLRFRMPERDVTVHDEVLGDVVFPYAELDDLVIRKRDGFPTYHFAVCVDDGLMGVTHVLRGQEHLNNTPKHVRIFEALGFGVPAFAHMPLIFNTDGSKMSKRDKDKAAKKAARDAKLEDHPSPGVTADGFLTWLGDKQAQLGRDALSELADAMGLALPEIDVEDFRSAGYLPTVVNNFIALLGWNPGVRDVDGNEIDRFDEAFLAEHFDLGRIGKSNAKFDREKLLAFNADTIQHGMNDAAFAETWLAWAERFDAELAMWAKADAARWAIAATAARPRAKTLKDAREAIEFAMIADDAIAYVFEGKATKKAMLKGEPTGLETLREFAPSLGTIDDWTPAGIEGAIQAFTDAKGLNMGKIAQPLRVAITGTTVSPPLGETLVLVGRESAVARVGRCLEAGAEVKNEPSP